jgi:hypothetical protein
MTSASQLTVGTEVTNGAYVGKVRKILDSRTVTVAWGPMMDAPDAVTTVEFSANLTRCERGQLTRTSPATSPAGLAPDDRAMMSRARALAAAEGEAAIRAWFRSQGRAEHAAPDTATVYSSAFGTAQALIADLLTLVDRITGHRHQAAARSVQPAMFPEPGRPRTPDMFDVVADEIAAAMNSRRPVADYDDEGPFIRLSDEACGARYRQHPTKTADDDADGAR